MHLEARWAAKLLVLVLLVSPSRSALGQWERPPNLVPPPPKVPEAKHHEGFFLRFQAGLGYAIVSNSDLSVSGPSGLSALALGGVVAEQLVLYGEIFCEGGRGWSMDRVRFPDSKADMAVCGLGPGLAYYVDPLNAYVSVTLARSSAVVQEKDRNNNFIEPSTGIGSIITLGKEWWASDDWGVGLAARFFFASVDNASVTSLALLFSATYN